MKYGAGYTFTHTLTNFLARTFLYGKHVEVNFMLGLVKGLEDKRILDFGCNNGYYTNMIKSVVPSCEVFGADINKCSLEHARKKYKDLKFLQVDDKFFSGEKFDVIVMSHVIEHVVNREKLISDLSRLLSDDGRIVVTVPQERIRGDCAITQLIYNLFRFRFENPHVIKLGYEDLTGLLGSAGLKIDKKCYSNLFFPFKSLSRKFYSLSLVVFASKRRD